MAGRTDVRELARVRAGRGGMTISLQPQAFPDPATWGIVLVDIARHLAAALQSEGHDPDDTLRRIRAVFDLEWTKRTSGAVGL